MTNKIARAVGIAVLAAGLAPVPTIAQEQNESVAAYRDWTVFNPSDPKECYIVSPPVSSKATRGGETVQVRRGEIRLFVTIRPEAGVDKEVSFTGGYPFRSGSEVEVDIGGAKFTLNVGEDEAAEWAWPASPEADKDLVNAMRKGASAEVVGTSARGTTTTDSFSLFGFSAALQQAEKLCN